MLRIFEQEYLSVETGSSGEVCPGIRGDIFSVYQSRIRAMGAGLRHSLPEDRW